MHILHSVAEATFRKVHMLHFHPLVLSLLTAMLTDCFRFVPLMGVPNCPSPPLL